MRTLTRWGAAALAAGLLGLFPAAGRADDKPAEVKVGDKAPAFAATDQDGKAWKSADHFGKKTVVVFFFPAAFTGG